ncbi:MAG: glycosyltransferase family 87 protein [bacterium]
MSLSNNEKRSSSSKPNGTWNQFIHHPWLKYLAWTAILAALADFAFNAIIQPTLWKQSIDFTGYYDWAKYLNPKIADGTLPWINYPPFWGLVIKPFTLFPFAIMQHVWRALQAFLVFLFIWQAIKWLNRVRPPEVPYLYLTLVCLLTLFYSPVISTLFKGQANVLILVLLGLSLLYFYRNRQYLSGIILGIATMIKILPGFLIIYWLWKREYKLAIAAIATIITISLLTILILGLPMHITWVKQTIRYSQYIQTHWNYQGNISLFAMLRESQVHGLVPPFIPASILQYIVTIGVGLSVLLVIPRRKQKSPIDYAIEYAFAISCIPLMSIYTESHHFVFVLIGYVAVIAAGKDANSLGKILVFCGWLLISYGFHIIDKTVFPTKYYLFYYIEMLGGVVLWLGLGTIIIRKRKIPQTINI